MEDNYKNNMVFGIHPVLELIRSQKEIEKVYIQGGVRSPEITEIANTCRANGVPVQFVPIEKMNRLTRKNHQGVVDSSIMESAAITPSSNLMIESAMISAPISPPVKM